MPLNTAQRAKLLEGIHPGRVSQRNAKKDGTGPMLSYIEAWDARATLIRIFGFGGFSADVVEVIPTEKGVIVGLRLTVYGIGPDGQDVTYTEYGADSAGYKELDDLVKTAASEALKRCCTNLGDQFGLSLYNNGSHRPVIMRTLDQADPESRGPNPVEQIQDPVERIAEKIKNLSGPEGGEKK
jgi:recombination DNA repair RAD52 pathway protein